MRGKRNCAMQCDRECRGLLVYTGLHPSSYWQAKYFGLELKPGFDFREGIADPKSNFGPGQRRKQGEIWQL